MGPHPHSIVFIREDKESYTFHNVSCPHQECDLERDVPDLAVAKLSKNTIDVVVVCQHYHAIGIPVTLQAVGSRLRMTERMVAARALYLCQVSCLKCGYLIGAHSGVGWIPSPQPPFPGQPWFVGNAAQYNMPRPAPTIESEPPSEFSFEATSPAPPNQ